MDTITPRSRGQRYLPALLLVGQLAAMFTCAPALAAKPALSPREVRMGEFIDQNNGKALALLEQVVNINSGTQNFAGVRAVGQVFSDQFAALGFTTQWVDGSAFKRAGHLLAIHRGSGPGLLLIGHLDTVFAANSPFQRFERIGEHMARGPGVIDMKGGDVIIVQALKALHSQGLLAHMNITVVLDGDEESVGSPVSLARKTLLDAARGARYAIAFEDGDGDPHTAVIARRGSSNWRLRVSGTRAHSSQIFRLDIGAGAIYEAARILSGFYRQLHSEANLTFNPGMIIGGTQADFDAAHTSGKAFGKSNVISSTAVVSGDLRSLTITQRERAKQQMTNIVAQHLPHTHAEIHFSDHYPPLAPGAGNQELLALFDQASRDLGSGTVSAVDPAKAGAADVSFTAGLVSGAIDGVGLMGDGGHTRKEIADLRTLPVQSKRVAVLMARLLAKKGGVSRN